MHVSAQRDRSAVNDKCPVGSHVLRTQQTWNVECGSQGHTQVHSPREWWPGKRFQQAVLWTSPPRQRWAGGHQGKPHFTASLRPCIPSECCPRKLREWSCPTLPAQGILFRLQARTGWQQHRTSGPLTAAWGFKTQLSTKYLSYFAYAYSLLTNNAIKKWRKS